MLCYCNLFYFLIVHLHTNKKPLAVILFATCFSLYLNCISIGAFTFSKLSCVSMCTFMHAHTYTPHTSTIIHWQMQSHVYCLGKFVFLCSGNFITNRSLFVFCTFRHMNAHAHPPTHAHTPIHVHAHAHTFMYTRRSHASITNMFICIHKNGFGSHPSNTHTHMHTCTHIHTTGLCFVNLCLNYYLITLWSLVAMSTVRCEPKLQECTHTHLHKQTHTRVQTIHHSA